MSYPLTSVNQLKIKYTSDRLIVSAVLNIASKLFRINQIAHLVTNQYEARPVDRHKSLMIKVGIYNTITTVKLVIRLAIGKK